MDLRRLTVRAAIVGLALGLAADARAQILSPGPLARPHTSLEGDGNCAECHSAGRRVDPPLCFECHGDVGGTIRAGRGFHGRNARTQPCAQCHVEHRGAGAALVRWPGGDRRNFEHQRTGYRLEGAHARTECSECHTTRNARGNATYLGLAQSCVPCHDDFHEGRFGRECQSCHGFERWQGARLETFDHSRARFPRRGAHARVECAECHGTPPRYRGIAFERCTDCHEDPHRGELGAACTNCHTEDAWTEVDGTRRHHPGVSLANGHADVACAGCHDRGNLQAPSRGVGCVNCHAPVHEAAFGRDCRSCHTNIKWIGLPEATGRAAHARTVFPLEGAHQTAECAGCHKPELARPVRYRGLEFDHCGDCHDDFHRGDFDNFVAAGDCAVCHVNDAFRPARFGAADHAQTGFALEGLHAFVACTGCHEGEPPRSSFDVRSGENRPRADGGHPTRPEPESASRHPCADCHANPHGDQFAREMAQNGCATCHSAAGWQRPNISHAWWPLTGAHATADCDSCHAPTPADRRAGRGASYRGVSRRCEGCHDDAEHLGQFRQSSPERTCEHCHSTDSFAIPRFDHTAKVGYELVGRHADVECASCHRTERREGDEAVRYRLGYRDCRDCHANPHNQGGAR